MPSKLNLASLQFKRAQPEDHRLLLQWLKNPPLRPWWETTADCALTQQDLGNFVKGAGSIFTHWLGGIEDRPLIYILTSDPDSPACTHLHPHLEDTGQTLTLDLYIGDSLKAHEHELIAQMLLAFVHSLPETVSALTFDPQAKNPAAIQIYTQAGFGKIADWNPAEGPTAGSLHFLMKLKRTRKSN